MKFSIFKNLKNLGFSYHFFCLVVYTDEHKSHINHFGGNFSQVDWISRLNLDVVLCSTSSSSDLYKVVEQIFGLNWTNSRKINLLAK